MHRMAELRVAGCSTVVLELTRNLFIGRLPGSSQAATNSSVLGMGPKNLNFNDCECSTNKDFVI